MNELSKSKRTEMLDDKEHQKICDRATKVKKAKEMLLSTEIDKILKQAFKKKGVTMSNGEQPKATSCPNCGQPAIRAGNEITCETCDAVFTVTKKQGAKVKELGPIDDHEKRIRRLEGVIQNAGLPGSQAKKTEQEQEQEQEEEDL